MRSILIFILLIGLPTLNPVALFGAAPQASPKAKIAEPTGNRFLFVMDNSSAMQKRDQKLRQAVFDTIHSGVSGRMTLGDTFGLWLYNAETDTRFPMQTWDPSRRLDFGSRVNTFLRERGYRKHSNLSALVRDINAVLRSVGDVTVVLFNDGNDRIVGTPFDREINGFYKELGAELASEKEPFITVLVAEQGQFVAYAVARPGEQLALPPVPLNPSRKPGGNRVPQAEVAETPPKPSPNTRPARQVPRIVITRESNAADQLAAAQARTTSTEPAPTQNPTPTPAPVPAPAPVAPVASTVTSTPPPPPVPPLSASVSARVFPPGATSPPNRSVEATMPAAAAPPALVHAEHPDATHLNVSTAPEIASVTPLAASNPPAMAVPFASQVPPATRSAPPLVSSLLPQATPVNARSSPPSPSPSSAVNGVALPNPSNRSNAKLYGAVAMLLGALTWGVASWMRSGSQDRGSYISRAMPRNPSASTRKPR